MVLIILMTVYNQAQNINFICELFEVGYLKKKCMLF